MAREEDAPGVVVRPKETPARYQYPFAASPDIIRSNQKDSYFQAVVLEHLSNIVRKVYGARFLHAYAGEARTSADLLYLGLTTLIGNRTLGEEYCDIVQIEDGTRRLPDFARRAGYISTSLLLPYGLTRLLPILRRRIRALLESRLQRKQQYHQRGKSISSTTIIQAYILKHLDTLTSSAPLYAVSLAIFYFNGAYYHLSKRLWGLRYIFTRQLQPSDQRVGYEVLGVLLALQFSVQTYLHLRSLISSAEQRHEQAPMIASGGSAVGSSSIVGPTRQDGAEQNENNTGDNLLFDTSTGGADIAKISRMTHTPEAEIARLDLGDADRMQWLSGKQARKCTLCLEPMKDPSATTCGHIFCWTCICDWCREKPECPLCRQNCLPQHILPLKG